MSRSQPRRAWRAARMTSERIIGRPGRLPLVRRVPATNVGTLIGVALALVAAAAIAWSALPAVQAETCGHELEDSSLSGSDRDRAVLVALHGCTAGDEWMHDSNWGTEEALSLWHGVTVDANSRVARLELSGNGLQGAIPAVLGLLSELKVLDLSRNPLSGSLPASLGDLSKLHTLDLSSTQRLGGSIPGDLGGLSNLEVLRLDRNRLTGTIPASLGTLAQLTVLNLDHNDLSGSIPSALGDLTKLKQLRLSFESAQWDGAQRVGQPGGPGSPRLGQQRPQWRHSQRVRQHGRTEDLEADSQPNR